MPVLFIDSVAYKCPVLARRMPVNDAVNRLVKPTGTGDICETAAKNGVNVRIARERRRDAALHEHAAIEAVFAGRQTAETMDHSRATPCFAGRDVAPKVRLQLGAHGLPPWVFENHSCRQFSLEFTLVITVDQLAVEEFIGSPDPVVGNIVKKVLSSLPMRKAFAELFCQEKRADGIMNVIIALHIGNVALRGGNPGQSTVNLPHTPMTTSYLTAFLCPSTTRNSRSKVTVRTGHMFKKMIEDYERQSANR